MPKIKDIEPTPNPNAMKFILREPLTAGAARSYESAAEAEGDRLASSLFAIAHVKSVFYMDRFLTVTKDPFGSWDELLPKLAIPIREQPGIDGTGAVTVSEPRVFEASADDAEMLARINLVLDEKIRPGLAGDGGGLQVIDLTGKTLTVQYQGACGTCPSSIAGTLMAIERFLRQDVDPDINVIAI
jgi:Fe-S cluster biogenesis protein NfuA